MDYNTITIKLGSNVVLDENYDFDFSSIEEIVRQIKPIKDKGLEPLLVSSGAIGLGAKLKNKDPNYCNMGEKEALASIGQYNLMFNFSKIFSSYGMDSVGQLLTIYDNIDSMERRKNLSQTINSQYKMNTIPIVNENDSVSTEEIEYGDNDILAAHMAGLVGSELLVLLSNVEGIYNREGMVIPYVEDTSWVKECISEKKSSLGSGGGNSKIRAAEISSSHSIPTVVAKGKKESVLENIMEGYNEGTFFNLANKKF